MYTKKSRELSQNGKQTPCLSFYVIFSASLFLTFLGLPESQLSLDRQGLAWNCLVPALLQALEDLLLAGCVAWVPSPGPCGTSVEGTVVSVEGVVSPGRVVPSGRLSPGAGTHTPEVFLFTTGACPL